MGDYFVSIAGTPEGARLATLLALTAAFLHAVFGALQKGRYDPWLSRGVIDVFALLMAIPVAVFLVPWPKGGEWGLLAIAMVIHFPYKVGMAMAYSRGAFTVVYPVVRGTGPLLTVVGAYLIFGETFSATQWMGVGLLLAGIFGLAVYNYIFLNHGRKSLLPALAFALLTGGTVALYTTYDAYAIRAIPDPFTFIAWFFVLTSIDFALIGTVRWWRMPEKPSLGPLIGRGVIGALVAYGSFGSVLMATRLDKVGEAAVLRETSTVFAALIGWIFLKDTVGPRRLVLMALIALGAVVVEAGG